MSLELARGNEKTAGENLLRRKLAKLDVRAIFFSSMALTYDTPDERARQADKIVKNPSNYKICEGCDSIVLTKAHTCPNCASYRFRGGMDEVVAQARILGRRERRSVMAADFE